MWMVEVGKKKGFATKTPRHEEYLIADFADFTDFKKKNWPRRCSKDIRMLNNEFHHEKRQKTEVSSK